MGQIMNTDNAKENGEPLSAGRVNREDAVANYLKGIINNGNQ